VTPFASSTSAGISAVPALIDHGTVTVVPAGSGDTETVNDAAVVPVSPSVTVGLTTWSRSGLPRSARTRCRRWPRHEQPRWSARPG
jgi:hypothetical protein